MRLILSLAALACAQPALAQPAAPVPAESPADTAAIRLAQERGRLIYAYDQAAWHGTDDMLKKVRNPERTMGGYIADGPAEAPTLIFYSNDPANPQALYIAQFDGNRLVSGKVLAASDDHSLSPRVLGMIAAKRTATEAFRSAPGTFRCGDKPFNTVVLPPVTPGGSMLVYLLTPQTDLTKLPLGGHFRVEVGADGKAGPVRGFTRSCISVPIPGANDRGASIGIGHLLDPVPTEIHAFSSLTSKKRLIVIIENPEKRYYSVENGLITRLSNDLFKSQNGF
jgi:hypothetical protein